MSDQPTMVVKQAWIKPAGVDSLIVDPRHGLIQ